MTDDPQAIVPHDPALLEGVALPRDQNPARVYLASLASSQSRRTQEQKLQVVAELLTNGRLDAFALPWALVRFQHLAAVRAELLRRNCAPSTINRTLTATRGTLRAAWRLGQLPTDEYLRAEEVGNVTGETLLAGRDLASGELHALFGVCDLRTATGARDAALLALLYAAGLRREEAAALDMADYEAEHMEGVGRLTVRHGKGRRQRTVYVNKGAKDALDVWLEHRGEAPGPLLVPVNKGGRVTVRRLTSQAIYSRTKALAQRAGVRDFSPHDLRRSFVGDLLDQGVDLVTVQALAGHAKPETTARCDRRGERVKVAAARTLHVPVRRPER